jgi:hypothetical protein
MYAVVQCYKLNPTDCAELRQQLADTWAPLLRRLPGFVSYYWVDTSTTSGVAFCTFEDQESATAALADLTNFGPAWIIGQLNPAETLAGAITVYANAGL